MDIDSRMYEEQEAHALRVAGWVVIAPEDAEWEPIPSLCRGVDDEGCPVRTPNVRCHWCNKTRRLRREAHGWSAGGPRRAA